VSPRSAPSCQTSPLWLKSVGKKLVFFGINLPKRGIPPYAIFTKFGLGKEVPGSHPHAKFHHCGFKNVDLQPPKIAKNGNCWYKFAPKEKFRGSTEKVEYRCSVHNYKPPSVQ